MDQSKSDKFAELSPVLELVYVMLTNMAKYMDVYATDIEAEQNAQYMEAKDALKGAISKFDMLYGLKSASSADVPAAAPIVAEQTEVTPMPTAPDVTQPQPYDFASGSDPDSLKKAKQAVEELKTLFADMKKQEAEEGSAAITPVVPVTEEVAQTPVQPVPVTPVTEPAPMPTFVAPTEQPVAPVAAPAVAMPTPMNTPNPAQDATEIDSILAELKKLQNKGTPQL